MEYKEAIDWLYSQLPMFSRIGAAAYKPGLERSWRLADHFGNPQSRWKSVHIAGTNGKGSVSNMISAVLQKQGYKTGLYTSPHLVDFRERIRINGRMIPEEKVVEFVENWQRSGYDGDKPSFFELTMMMAFDWFAVEKVDIAVIETGMGGRLDSTNIITPLLSVITNISKDHTQFLGDTPEKIAFEKAGIIKTGIPAVIGEAEGDVEKVFEQKALQIGSRLRKAYAEPQSQIITLEDCPLKGDYQKKNLQTALTAIDELRHNGLRIEDRSIIEGIKELETLTGFVGRWTIMRQEPLTICDTGHNEAGLRYNLAQLKALMKERPGGRIRFVIGFVADKDIDNILPMFPRDGEYYLTQAQMPRALDSKKLRSMVLEKVMGEHSHKERENVRSFTLVGDALEKALQDAKKEDIIFVGGSTFIVAEAISS